MGANAASHAQRAFQVSHLDDFLKVRSSSMGSRWVVVAACTISFTHRMPCIVYCTYNATLQVEEERVAACTLHSPEALRQAYDELNSSSNAEQFPYQV